MAQLTHGGKRRTRKHHKKGGKHSRKHLHRTRRHHKKGGNASGSPLSTKPN